MNKLDQLKRLWTMGGCSVQVVDAPKDAQSFDKMIIVFADNGRKTIKRVSLYNSTEDKIVSEY